MLPRNKTTQVRLSQLMPFNAVAVGNSSSFASSPLLSLFPFFMFFVYLSSNSWWINFSHHTLLCLIYCPCTYQPHHSPRWMRFCVFFCTRNFSSCASSSSSFYSSFYSISRPLFGLRSLRWWSSVNSFRSLSCSSPFPSKIDKLLQRWNSNAHTGKCSFQPPPSKLQIIYPFENREAEEIVSEDRKKYVSEQNSKF